VTLDPIIANELAKAMNSDQAKELTLPASHEFGALFGELASIVRFYGTENLKRIFKKWARDRYPGKVIDAAEFRRVMPLLSTASMESDDELQDRWAALLETAASGDKDYLPSYGQTLSQLTVQEARLLSAFWTWANNPTAQGNQGSPRQSVSARMLLSVFHPEISANLMWTYQGRPEDAPPEVRSLVEKSEEVDHIIDDLVRIGIFELIRETRAPIRLQFGEHLLETADRPPHVLIGYSLTLYGQKFIRAVTPKAVSDQQSVGATSSALAADEPRL
jgi:hypothetical protein